MPSTPLENCICFEPLACSRSSGMTSDAAMNAYGMTAMSAPVLHKCLAGGAELDETRAALDGFARKLGELPSGASRAASRPDAVTVLFEGGGGLEMRLAESAAPQAAFALPWLELTVSRTAYAPGSYVRAKDEAVVLKKLERMLGA